MKSRAIFALLLLKISLLKSNTDVDMLGSKKVANTCNTSKDELDLLGDDDMGAFSGSQADLEGAAENLFSSSPCPQPLRFEYLSLRTLQTIPTPDTALQHKIESKLEKSLGTQFNIQLQQQMGVFQASMLEAMKSLRENFQSIKKPSEAEVDQTFNFKSWT